MTFIAGLILGLALGGFLGLLLFSLLTSAAGGDRQLQRSHPDDDPYAISERMSRKARALERFYNGAGEQRTFPLQGKTRIGKDPR